MSKKKHNYGKDVNFGNVIAKEQFDALLDQVLIISKSEYDEESSDNFQGFIDYWNNAGVSRFNNKLVTNGRRIEKFK